MADGKQDSKGQAVEWELRREAARIFPKLANAAGYLEKLNEQPDGKPPVFGVFNRRNNYRRCVLTIEEKVVEGFKKRGWVNQSEGR